MIHKLLVQDEEQLKGARLLSNPAHAVIKKMKEIRGISNKEMKIINRINKGKCNEIVQKVEVKIIYY